MQFFMKWPNDFQYYFVWYDFGFLCVLSCVFLSDFLFPFLGWWQILNQNDDCFCFCFVFQSVSLRFQALIPCIVDSFRCGNIYTAKLGQIILSKHIKIQYQLEIVFILNSMPWLQFKQNVCPQLSVHFIGWCFGIWYKNRQSTNLSWNICCCCRCCYCSCWHIAILHLFF